MFADTLTITYNSVTKTLNRQTDGNYTAKYGLDDGTEVFTLRVEHTVPSSPTVFGESHMIRLDVDYYDAEGEYDRTESTWLPLKTSNAKQNSTTLGHTAKALRDFVSDANLDKLIAREA